MARSFQINGRPVGPGNPCYVIAEAGVNHNGSIETARALVQAAHAAGADAVKFQAFKAEALTTRSARKARYQEKSGPQGESQQAMLKKLELSLEAHQELQTLCRELGIDFLSTPFDSASAEELQELDLPAIKVSSGDLTNHPFLLELAAYGKPLIVSTGMSTLQEVEATAAALSKVENLDLALLHCVTCYPTEDHEVNLRAMHTMMEGLPVPVGYSDHSMGSAIPLAAIAMGACILEKHLTLDRTLEGPDHAASMEPEDFKQMVRDIRRIETAFGSGVKEPCSRESENAAVVRKSLVAAAAIPAGTVITSDLIAIKRPGTGISPSAYSETIGRKTLVDLAEGDLLTEDALSGEKHVH